MPETSSPPPFLRLLGGASLELAGVPATGRAAHRHRIALLAILVVNRGRAVSRDKLIGYLWPERDTEAGRNLLKVAVHGLRKELGEAAIRTSGDQLSVNLELLRSDVTEFLEATEASDDASVIGRYAGPFLDGFFIKDAEELERWTESQRVQFATLYTSALERLAHRAETSGDFDGAARLHRAQLEVDPYRADVARRLVRVLVSAGDRAAAIQFAELFVKRREENLDIGDEEGIVQLARSKATRITPEPRPALEIAKAKVVDVDAGAATVIAPNDTVPFTTERRSVRRRPLFMSAGVGAALVLAALTATVFALKRDRAPQCPGSASCTAAAKQTNPNLIAILPFRTSGADASLAYLQDGMAELLSAEFTGDGGANSVDPGVVARAMARAAKSGHEVDREDAVTIARQLGAGQVLMGSVVGTRARMTITASVLNVESGDTRARSIMVEGSADSLAAVVGRLAVRLQAHDVGAWRLSAREPGTTSTQALRAFIDGRAAYKRGRDDQAFTNFAQALDLDSSFVLAAYWLTISSKLTRPVSDAAASRAYRLAWKQQSRLGPDRRELLQSMLGPEGPDKSASFAQMQQAIERAANDQPRSSEAWFLLGDLYFHRGALLGFDDWHARARRAFEQSVSLDTVMGSVSHLATLAFMERNMTEHARWLQQLERLGVNDNYTLREQYAEAIAGGDARQLKTARDKWVHSGFAYRDSYDGFPWLVGVHVPLSEIDSVLKALNDFATTDEQRRLTTYFTKSVAMNAGQPMRAETARNQYYAANAVSHDFDLVTYAEDDSAAAERLMRATVTNNEHLPGEVKCEAMLSRLRRSDTTGARAIASALRAENDSRHLDAPVCAALIEGIVASLAPHATTAPLARVDSILRGSPPGMPSIWTYDLALAFARLGDYRSAAAIASRRMIPRSARLAVSLRDEGRWAEMAGDKAHAVLALGQFVAIRANAEPSKLNDVAEVRARLAKLESK